MADRGEERHGKWRVKSVQDKMRNLVSKEKRRFKDEKYDLDLTYINDKIIAMGFPSSGSEVITTSINASFPRARASTLARFATVHPPAVSLV